MNCDKCIRYIWTYDYCRKYDCEVDTADCNSPELYVPKKKEEEKERQD